VGFHPLPLDTSCQAEYLDGFIYDETELDDVSQWTEGKNVFYDILNHIPEQTHGPLVRFSAFWKDARYDVDWTVLPDNARPIRFRHGYARRSVDGSIVESGWFGIDFGYQYNDEDGHNQQEVLELR
jgi:hypothetical protein